VSLSRYDVTHPLYFALIPKMIRQGKLALRKIAPDIVNAHHFPSYITAYQYDPQKTFWYSHEPYPLFHNAFFRKNSALPMRARSYGWGLLYKEMDIKYARQVPLVVSNSHFSQKIFYDAFQRWPEEVIYPGYCIDPSLASDEPFQNTNGKRILVVGPSSAIKGFEYALQAYERLARNYELELVIIGNVDPKYLRLLTTYIQGKRPGWDTIKIEGRVSSQKLIDLYASSHLTFYCSINEPFGIVPIESIIMGTPCVGFAMGGLVESLSIDELKRFLVPPGSVKDLVKVTEEILNSNYRISSESRSLIQKKFSWDRITDQYETLVYKFQETC
jgi:glycosyltransferase involved in cell wall biosynthesis